SIWPVPPLMVLKKGKELRNLVPAKPWLHRAKTQPLLKRVIGQSDLRSQLLRRSWPMNCRGVPPIPQSVYEIVEGQVQQTNGCRRCRGIVLPPPKSARYQTGTRHERTS